MSNMLEVHAKGERHTLALQAGDAQRDLAAVLAREGHALNTRCAGRGLCNGCEIELRSLGTPSSPTRVTKACQLTVEALKADAPDATIFIPTRSLLAHEPQAVTNFKLRIPWARNPLIADAPAGALGAAVDVGTTTVALMLVELHTGRVRGKASAFNRQQRFGDNVLTRINHCSTDPPKVAAMQQAICHDTIAPLIETALDQAKAGLGDIACYAIAGNTTMLHLLAGVDPSPMGVAPFTPRFIEHRVLASDDLGLPGRCEAHLLPSIAAYVGADLVAGCLVTGQAYDTGANLLVDVGTNGEMILKHGDKLVGCATAAGPAFEGAGLTSGMRAADGAIEHVRFNRHDVHIETIANAAPIGICGSAYIDFLARGRRAKVLSHVGRIEAQGPRITTDDYGKRYVLAGAGDDAVTISEADIAALLQAKGAIAAGVITLMQRFDLDQADIDKVFLAGGFGLHIDPHCAIDSGLLPGFAPKQIEPVGNASLGGAYPAFEMNYIEQLSLPDF